MLQPVKIVFKSMYISCSICRLNMLSKFLSKEVSSMCIVHYKNDVQYNCSVLKSCDMSCMNCVVCIKESHIVIRSVKNLWIFFQDAEHKDIQRILTPGPHAENLRQATTACFLPPKSRMENYSLSIGQQPNRLTNFKYFKNHLCILLM
jgi:hypothetical protein